MQALFRNMQDCGKQTVKGPRVETAFGCLAGTSTGV